MRVVECWLAAMILARACGATNWRTVRTLGQAAQHMQADGVKGQLIAVNTHLAQGAYAAHEVCGTRQQHWAFLSVHDAS